MTGRYVAIRQQQDAGQTVLLSPNQVRALLRFIERKGKP